MYRLHFTNFFYIFLCFLVSVFIFQEYGKELPGATKLFSQRKIRTTLYNDWRINLIHFTKKFLALDTLRQFFFYITCWVLVDPLFKSKMTLP